MHALIALIAGFTAKAAVKIFTVTEGQNWN
jgi:hypothetical protein